MDLKSKDLNLSSCMGKKEYILEHREIRHLMVLAKYPQIEAERTTDRFIVNGLAWHPHYASLSNNFVCNGLPVTIKIFQERLAKVEALVFEQFGTDVHTLRCRSSPLVIHPFILPNTRAATGAVIVYVAGDAAVGTSSRTSRRR